MAAWTQREAESGARIVVGCVSSADRPALADPTRRGVLERLGSGSATITELAEPFGISLTAMKKHVRVLEDAELVATAKVGRTRRCSLGPRRLEDLQEWIETPRNCFGHRQERRRRACFCRLRPASLAGWGEDGAL